MSDFYLYRKKKRDNNNLTPQSNVAQTTAKDKTIRARIWGDLLKEYEIDREDSGVKNESQYIRMVFKKHLDEQKAKRHKFELEGI